ncbi:uncharacterized protein LOC130014811 [Mercurialis annua]|uniref:uncharacterized protein LOC130014811 n=1 Tax=Mercurialis annua TaxID=3986 RepID=UPI0024ACDF72|nr:uncharacterized protein LOC130014811 [Mercurialis annua]
MLPVVVYVLAQTDIIKYILSRPYLRNRMGKWAVAMSEFTLVYVPQKAVKGQVLADFHSDHPGVDIKEGIGCMELHPWKLWFDGSRTEKGAGAGIVIISPSGARFTMSCSLTFKCTNNQAGYEALILGLEILMELGAKSIQVWGDSLLVIKQVSGEYKCESELLIRYCNKAKHLIGGFSDTWLEYTERIDNMEANDLAQHGSGYKPCYEYEAIRRDTPNLVTRDDAVYKATHSVYQLDFLTDWRKEITKWFESPDMSNRRLRTLALNYIILADELYKKGSDGLLFRCIGPKEAMLVMAEVHGGIAGAHQAGPRMRWLIHKYGFYWPKMEQDSIPLKSPSQESVIKFFREFIILRHGLPETITTDQGTMFTGSDVTDYAKEMGFKLIRSTPYYAQANGQAEAINKAIKGIIQKMIEDNPKQWHHLLTKVVWANRTSQKSATGTTPFKLVYGYDAMLPMELTVASTRRKMQHVLTKADYHDKMVLEALDLDEERLLALDHLEAQKKRVERVYNKRVKSKSFLFDQLVWKVILSIGAKKEGLGKWSPNWEGPYKVVRVLGNGAYILADIDGRVHDRAINAQYLKKYVPSC